MPRLAASSAVVRRADLSVQPGCKWAQRPPGLGHLGLGPPGRQPGWASEVAVRGQRLVAQPFGTRMILRVAVRYPGELVTVDRVPGLAHGRGRPLEFGAGDVVGNGA